MAEALYRITWTTRLSMVFLSAVLLAAYLLGSGPAYFAACVAFLVYNFYLVEPRFTLSIEAEDIITLAAFFIAAMLTGNLTGRVRDEAARAQQRARTTSILFEASRAFSAASDEMRIREILAEHLAAAAKGAAFVRDGAGALTLPAGEALKGADLHTALSEPDPDDAATAHAGGWSLRRLVFDGQAFGAAGWRTEQVAAGEEQSLLEILVDAGAAALGRARLAGAKAEAETRARTEDLRNALLSSISHDLRTPLAAIMASSSSLHEFGDDFAPEVRKDLALTIQEEAQRLDSFVANLLNMTRLEAGGLAVQSTPFSAHEAVDRTAQRLSRISGRAIGVALPAALPEGLGDPVLFEQAFGNVLENALRYAPPGAPIRVTGVGSAEAVEIVVRDQGPGVPPEDLERIFQKFFRSSASGAKPGTGLGLSIARGLIESMGGEIGASLPTDGGPGLCVHIRLPAA